MLTAIVERRLYTRVCREVPVNIYYADKLLGECKTINIGVGGVLIKIGDIGLMENSLIQVKFVTLSTHSLFGLKIPAVVKRCEKNNIAVSFENLEKGTEELIYSLLLNNSPK